ncbi:hypothetical protein SKAU_G00059640 [Synaphobranchus kaupii]|uniref:Reverse transcriptase domain-containing protein n=1 Tax=Synaphobranchus kaupii TaxID=118154 RepID=A0A9Q1G5Q5_SYNKA|nr:hypothetical protein SKAU_G00059640 [Synaphobranchus kaupii]
MESSGEVDTETELINIKAELRTMEGEIHRLLERQMRLNSRIAMLEAAGAGATRMAGVAIHSGPNAGSDEDEPQGRSSAGAPVTSTPENSHLCLPTPLRPLRRRPGAAFFTPAPTDGVWGCVLSPLLYSLYTHHFSAAHPSNSIIKFADDTTVVGCISRGDETAYRDEDLQNLITTLPDIQDGAAIWIRKLEEEMMGKMMALGDVKALLGKVVGREKMLDIIEQAGYRGAERSVVDGQQFDPYRQKI